MTPRTHRPTSPAPFSTPAGQRRIALTLALSLISAMAGASSFVALGRLIDDGIAVPPALAALTLGLIGAVAMVTGQWLAQVGARVEEAPLRERLLRRWWDSSPESLNDEQAGRIVSLMTDSVERVSTYRQTFLGPTLGSVLGPFAVLIVIAFALDPVTAGVLALALPVIPLAIGGFTKAFRKTSGQSRAARARLASRYLESIQGLETITLLGAAPRVERDLARVGESNRRATMRLLARNQLVLFVTDTVFSLGAITTTVVLAAWRLDSGAITTGEAVAIMLCAVLLVQPLGVVGSFFYLAMGGQASQRAISRFLASAPRSMSTASQPTPEGSAIEVRDASLGYRDKHVAHVDGFTVPPGGRAVITGPSGGGKSTLLRALKGDVIPSSGEVRVAGIALNQATRDGVRAASALVDQSTWLFTGTIAQNLRVANPGAADEDLWDALDLVDLSEFVRRSPDGLNTVIGERGLAISGGQAQRLSLARAFLSGRRILLLDEPTSQVDLASERIIMAALERLASDHTMVLVTHRGTAVGDASHWMMRDGALTEVSDD